MAKKLILITSGFPYGKSETFLETEIGYLANGFEEIHILCPQTNETHIRELPANCTLSFYNKTLSASDKILALGLLFNRQTQKEIKIIRNTYQLPLTKGIISTLLISLYQAKRIAKLCQKGFLSDNTSKAESVFYSYWCDDTAIALSLLKKNNQEINCISRTHGWDVYFGVHDLKYLPFRQFITANLNTVFTISKKGKEEIENTWKVENLSNIHVARLGVDKQQKKPESTSSIFTLVSCSNVISLKRVELIANAVLSLSTPIRWVHFGDGPLLDSIQSLCVASKKENHTIDFFGRVSNEEVLQFYKSNRIDAFINVSSSEGVPVSIMEAMSFRIPCIASNVGGNSEIVNNENGYLLPSDPTIGDIQIAIKILLDDDTKRLNAYQTWKEKYNAEKNYTDFVEKLLNLK
jgi:glycosyltransferase involved in cell wall biosynthesis